MNRRGFTLVEMLIVIAVAGILLAIAIPQYGQNMTRRGMERQIREIQSEISSFRLSAIHRKERHRILIGPRILHFQRFFNGAWEPAVDAAPPANSGVPPARILTYEIQQLLGGALVPFNTDITADPNPVEFNERGYAGDFNLVTIVAFPVDTNMGDGCIIVDRARNNIGRMDNANTCQVR